MDPHNLAYALVQVAHNFGAVAVTAGGMLGYAMLRVGQPVRRGVGVLVLAGWVAQAASGAGFGAVSLAAYGQLPDLHRIAAGALAFKMTCAAFGIGLAALWLGWGARWPAARQRTAWAALALAGAAALTAAAFLRWFA